MCDISLNDLKIIFQELFEMYPAEIMWISAIQHRTLAIYQHIHLNDYTLAMLNYNKSVDIWLNYRDDEELNCCINIAEIYSDMAECCHFYIKDLMMANEYYNSAIQFYHLALEQHNTMIDEKIKIYKQLGCAYELKMEVNNDQKNYDYSFKSIEYYELYIQCMLSVYSTEDFAIYTVLQDIAKLHVIQHEFDQAILTYEKAIRIYQQLDKSILQERAFDGITDIYRHLITIYTSYQPNYQLALHYQNILHEHNMKLTLECLTYEPGKGRIVRRGDQYETDNKKKKVALHFRRLAKIHRAFDKNDLAYTYLCEALKLYNEIKWLNVNYEIEIVEEKIRSMNMMSK
jgi:tetratricopeptide (TPR) repeat protein